MYQTCSLKLTISYLLPLSKEHRGYFFSYKCMFSKSNSYLGEIGGADILSRAFDKNARVQSPELEFVRVNLIKKPAQSQTKCGL